MIEYIGILVGSLGLLATYVIYKKVTNPAYFIDIFDELLDYALNNADTQKQIYIFGALIGQGIKSGLGMTGKRGKFKLDDIIGEAIAGFAQQFLSTAMKPENQQGKLPDIPAHLRRK